VEDAKGILGEELPDARENPLICWRVIDPTIAIGSQFLTSGTYLSSDKLDFLRYKNSYLQNTFNVPRLTYPEIANILVNAFIPTGCQIQIDSCTLDNGYNIVLTGNPYLTPVVHEVRIRILHRIQYLSIVEQNVPSK